MKEIYYIKDSDWRGFLGQLSSEYKLIAPFEGIAGLEYGQLTQENLEAIVYPELRLTQPVKSFVYSPCQSLGEPVRQRTVILGVKACGLRALSVLDRVFLESDPVDPFYKAQRENTIIISGDCTLPGETCFCSLFGESPFPENGFDINLSFIDYGVLAEADERGRELLERYNVSTLPAQESQLNARGTKREASVKRLREINKDFSFGGNITEALKTRYESPVWDEFSKDCVGCGACTNICPSCHCFLLSEQIPEPAIRLEKVRTWDSCQYTGFARVAGGANPRGKLSERFRNRFYCKLEHKPESFDIFACTGCGRCIDACQGKIDIRETLTEVVR